MTDQILLVERSFLEMRSFPPIPTSDADSYEADRSGSASSPDPSSPDLESLSLLAPHDQSRLSDADTRSSHLHAHPHPILHPDLLRHILAHLPLTTLPSILRSHSAFHPLALPQLYDHILIDLSTRSHPLKARYLPLPPLPRLSAPHSGLGPRWDHCSYSQTRQYTPRDTSACSEDVCCLSEPPSPSPTPMPLREPIDPAPDALLRHTRALTIRHHRSHVCGHYIPPRLPAPGLDTLHFQMSNDDFLSWSFCRPHNRSRYPYYPISTFCPLLNELQPRRMVVSEVGTLFSFTPFAEWFPKGKYDGHTRLLARLQEVVLRLDMGRWRGTAHRAGGDFLCCLAERVGKVTIVFNVPAHVDPKRGPYGERDLLAEIVEELFLLGVLSKPGTKRRYVVAGLEAMVKRERASKAAVAEEPSFKGKEKAAPIWTDEAALELLGVKIGELVKQKRDDYGDVNVVESLPGRVDFITLKELRARTNTGDQVMAQVLDF